jgi:hypothetical protein
MLPEDVFWQFWGGDCNEKTVEWAKPENKHPVIFGIFSQPA